MVHIILLIIYIITQITVDDEATVRPSRQALQRMDITKAEELP